jgi:hypothetical protein
MKKINVLLIAVLSSIFFSCGNKEGKNDTNEDVALKELAKACSCNELVLTEKEKDEDEDGNISLLGKNITKKGSKELFTGICVEKDQNDSIVKKLDVKNGWLIKEISKVKIANKYITTIDMTYDNAEPSDGYTLIYKNSPKYYYTANCEEFKNGILYNYWSLSILDNDEQLFFKSELINGENPENDGKLKGMTDFEDTISPFGWCLNHPTSVEKCLKALNLIKTETPRFDYWKV